MQNYHRNKNHKLEKQARERITYTELLKLRLISSIMVLARDVWLPEPILPGGIDSMQATLSKIRATACLNVAAAVLTHNKCK